MWNYIYYTSYIRSQVCSSLSQTNRQMFIWCSLMQVFRAVRINLTESLMWGQLMMSYCTWDPWGQIIIHHTERQMTEFTLSLKEAAVCGCMCSQWWSCRTIWMKRRLFLLGVSCSLWECSSLSRMLGKFTGSSCRFLATVSASQINTSRHPGIRGRMFSHTITPRF